MVEEFDLEVLTDLHFFSTPKYCNVERIGLVILTDLHVLSPPDKKN
jgi:hypothetical protein